MTRATQHLYNMNMLYIPDIVWFTIEKYYYTNDEKHNNIFAHFFSQTLFKKQVSKTFDVVDHHVLMLATKN